MAKRPADTRDESMSAVSRESTIMKTRSGRRKAATLQSGRALPHPIRQAASEAFAESVSHVETDAVEIFEGALDDDSREFAKLGDALRAVQLQLGRASLVRDGHMPCIDNATQREHRGAEVLSAMTAGTCSAEGILTLITMFDYHRLRARQLARRSRRAA
jgi:hypothetical protein